jgi:hypothetical protein
MAGIDLIAGPAAEPVSVSDMTTALGFPDITDATLLAQLSSQLSDYITAARANCEDYCRRAFVTQTRLLRLDGWPSISWRYNWAGYREIVLPYSPLQSIFSVQYVDASGTVQTLLRDTSYGTSSVQYSYQLVRGNDLACGKIQSAWARPWPPIRMVPDNVLIKYRCGYGGPVTASMIAGSAILSGPVFNPDDAPIMAGETGTAVSVPGAGAQGAVLSSFVASVDANGQATLADAAQTEVADATVWVGQQVPVAIVRAIKFLAQWYYEQGSIVDQALPRVVTNLLQPYANEVS